MVVGIDKYPSCPLRGCCNDAESIAELLGRNEDNSLNFDVELNFNVESKAELSKMVRKCFDGDADVALFYYSGHGYINSYGGYLVTPDSSDGDEGLSLQDILGIVSKSRCKDKVIILDSCYSGKMGESDISKDNTSVISDGLTIMTASRSTEEAIEMGDHGLFTSLLIAALEGGAADVLGNITPGGIYSYIDKALGPWNQRPVFKTNVSRFTSLRNVEPQVDVNILKKLCEYFKTPDTNFVLDPSFEWTNTKEVEHEVIEPYAVEENVRIFKHLQQLESVGIVSPVGEEHMYFAAMNSKACRLTPLGRQYWDLVDKGRI